MTDEEKKVAAELQAKLDIEKAEKEKTAAKIGNIESMMKAIIDSSSKKNDQSDPEQESFDFALIDAEEMAKSMANDPDSQKEWLEKFFRHSVVSASDLENEDGEPIYSEEMKKSLEESESQGAIAINLILQTMQANNELMAKRDELLIAGMAQMAKSFQLTTKELVEMKKAMPSNVQEKTGDISDIDLKGVAQIPGSTDMGNIDRPAVQADNTLIMDTLQKSFYEGQPISVQTRYYEFMEQLGQGYDVASIKSGMSVGERNIFESNL